MFDLKVPDIPNLGIPRHLDLPLNKIVIFAEAVKVSQSCYLSRSNGVCF